MAEKAAERDSIELQQTQQKGAEKTRVGKSLGSNKAPQIFFFILTFIFNLAQKTMGV